MARFLVYLEPAEEGGYIVSAPALPGCVTQGETREEALTMVQDAIHGYILSLSMANRCLPAMRRASSRLLKLKRLHEPPAAAQAR
ncbi:MAG: type II toxin-antitoxin system HicB family antitoxin [Gammaproteobacteria bacterium]